MAPYRESTAPEETTTWWCFQKKRAEELEIGRLSARCSSQGSVATISSTIAQPDDSWLTATSLKLRFLNFKLTTVNITQSAAAAKLLLFVDFRRLLY